MAVSGRCVLLTKDKTVAAKETKDICCCDVGREKKAKERAWKPTR